jgi:hypothetical protein
MLKNKNIAILFFTLIVVMLGFGMIIPILPFLVEHFGGSGTAMGMLDENLLFSSQPNERFISHNR